MRYQTPLRRFLDNAEHFSTCKYGARFGQVGNWAQGLARPMRSSTARGCVRLLFIAPRPHTPVPHRWVPSARTASTFTSPHPTARSAHHCHPARSIRVWCEERCPMPSRLEPAAPRINAYPAPAHTYHLLRGAGAIVPDLCLTPGVSLPTTPNRRCRCSRLPLSCLPHARACADSAYQQRRSRRVQLVSCGFGLGAWVGGRGGLCRCSGSRSSLGCCGQRIEGGGVAPMCPGLPLGMYGSIPASVGAITHFEFAQVVSQWPPRPAEKL